MRSLTSGAEFSNSRVHWFPISTRDRSHIALPVLFDSNLDGVFINRCRLKFNLSAKIVLWCFVVLLWCYTAILRLINTFCGIISTYVSCRNSFNDITENSCCWIFQCCNFDRVQYVYVNNVLRYFECSSCIYNTVVYLWNDVSTILHASLASTRASHTSLRMLNFLLHFEQLRNSWVRSLSRWECSPVAVKRRFETSFESSWKIRRRVSYHGMMFAAVPRLKSSSQKRWKRKQLASFTLRFNKYWNSLTCLFEN